ncbi:hypothetical protein [Subtercola sp. YIM 133946]|uniref:hypothetical protein n=1 Tax=Subtercola sp. YIM 133946 TaxID=3118909 RepID=UPI002F92A699
MTDEPPHPTPQQRPVQQQNAPHERSALQQQKAEEALRAIAAGADPTREAFDLANDFTDAQTHRLKQAIRRLLRR